MPAPIVTGRGTKGLIHMQRVKFLDGALKGDRQVAQAYCEEGTKILDGEYTVQWNGKDWRWEAYHNE